VLCSDRLRALNVQLNLIPVALEIILTEGSTAVNYKQQCEAVTITSGIYWQICNAHSINWNPYISVLRLLSNDVIRSFSLS